MPRYIQGQLDWPKFRRDLRAYQDAQGLTGPRLAKQLHISTAALTRYYQGNRLPTSEVFAFAVLLMSRELRDYVTAMPSLTP